jgi:ComF family protein
MRFGEFLKKAFFYLGVPKCVSCKERLLLEDTAFCKLCVTKYREDEGRECPICLKPTRKCRCANKHMQSHFIKSHIKLYRYRKDECADVLDPAIYAMKRTARDDVFDFLAEELSRAVENSELKLSNAVITSIPRRKSAILRYGDDHAQLLAKRVASRLGIAYIQLFTSTAKRAQKSLNREERIANTDFKLIKEIDLKGKCVIILDDMVTTGSSMCSAATLIRSLGAKDIHALSVGYTNRAEN